MTRSFIALTLPDAALDQLEDVQREIPLVRRMLRATLHLTLAFLGEQPEEALEDLHEELLGITVGAFGLSLAGAGMYGNPRRPALGIEVRANPALNDLYSQVNRAIRQAGLRVEKRRFRPHVTIARFKGDDPTDPRLQACLAGLMSYRAAPFTVTQFALYESTLGAEGARHDILASYPLLGGASDEW